MQVNIWLYCAGFIFSIIQVVNVHIFDCAALMQGLEIIHGCMDWEAEFGPISRDEKKVIVGCSLEKFSTARERKRSYHHSYLIIRPHSKSKAPRPGRILKLKKMCWCGRRSCSRQLKEKQQQKNIQINIRGGFKCLLVCLNSQTEKDVGRRQNLLHPLNSFQQHWKYSQNSIILLSIQVFHILWCINKYSMIGVWEVRNDMAIIQESSSHCFALHHTYLP